MTGVDTVVIEKTLDVIGVSVAVTGDEVYPEV